ncbi:nicotinamide-nucleotide adenylyltransferase [Aeropyrum camini]|uniref:nicotinamide-nucleotide adenylyltransferase n=1 Tax=Aeropyrum camini TaxID=229980 RepID=UPI00210CD25D|nr:nicotinamide-nucleotide adenylyltransferase [Aeropyrum camini]
MALLRALIFGRFQPFHKGHLSIVKWAFERGYEEIVFLVGMASENYTPRNPFTAGERIEMIRLSFLDAGLPLEKAITATIRTLETSIGSVYYVLSYVPRVDTILTRNPVIAKIFLDAGVNVERPPLFNRDEWRGEKIRMWIARGDERWRSTVTPSTARFIEEIGGVERIRWSLASD